ncbi:MAG: hypothetical protein QF363_19570 [Planctomycetaceae bacterium]|jgi:hypothetical protein|nr:hypothetical protein [Planctomycetaceae bacterium]
MNLYPPQIQPVSLLALRPTSSIWSFLPTIACLVGILCVLLIIAFAIRKRFRQSEVAGDDRIEEMLVEYQEMRRQGDLTPEEFRSIKNRLLLSRERESRQEAHD